MDDLTVRISALEHFEYCPRQCGLVEVEGQWLDNRFTAAGQVSHWRVDGGSNRVERGVTVLRSLMLWHDELGLSGRADVVEVHGDDHFVPVEFKSGSRHGRTADVQLCAQALCLEHMFGTSVEKGFIWYSTTRRRHCVQFDEALRSDTVSAVAAIVAMVRSGEIPAAPNDARCDQCQLNSRCFPTVRDDPQRAYGLAELLLRGIEPGVEGRRS